MAETRSLPALRNRIVDLCLSLFVALSGFAPLNPDHRTQLDATAALILIGARVSLLFRRRFPFSVLVASTLLSVIAAIVGARTPAVVIPIAIAMYTVARHRSRSITLWSAAALAVLLPGVELIFVVSSADSLADVVSPGVIQPAVFVAFATALGLAIRYHQEAIRSANERARRAEESRESEAKRRVAEDRIAIARDLHDSVAHQIAVINLHAGVAARAVRQRPDQAESSIAVISDAARSVIAEIQDVLGVLRTQGERELSDEPGIDRIDALAGLFARSGLKVTIVRRGDLSIVPAETGTLAYRVVQEALTNAYKHGEEGSADLLIECSEKGLVVKVTNATFATNEAVALGHGLRGMQERVTSVGGLVDTRAHDGRFVLTASIPFDVTAPASTAGADRHPGEVRLAKSAGTL